MKVNPRILASVAGIFMLLLTGCGSSQAPPSPSSQNKGASTTTVADSSENKGASATTVADSSDAALDMRFKEAVDNYIEGTWKTWTKGESMGRCIGNNGGSLTHQAKDAVIEHGIEDAFKQLSGPDLESLSKLWDLCETKAQTTVGSPSTQTTPTRTLGSTYVNPMPKPSSVTNFESSVDYSKFEDAIAGEFQAAVDQYFDAATEKAGISVAIYTGNALWRYAKGNAGSSTPLTPGTPILIRSTSKMFLGGLVLRQIDQGLYTLSDTLASVLSGNEGYESLDKNVVNPAATVKDLLTMTSGIQNVKDYYRPEITELQESQNWQPIDVVRLVITDSVPPGTYEYSNTNSMLLGVIAEHAGRQQLNELYKSVFFDPLGIIALLLPQDAAPSNTARPHGDRTNWGGAGFGDITESSHHGTDWYWATGKTSWAAAGMITTPENMARWTYELLSDQGSALSPTARAGLFDSFTGPLIPIGGTEPEHQYGYHVTKTTLSLSGRSITAYGHPGSGGGYISNVFYSPELDMSISLMVNSHSDARSRADARGKITHRTLDAIAKQIFDKYAQR